MRHAFLNSEIRFNNIPKGFRFKPSNSSPEHQELSKWPLNISAQEAKNRLEDRGITPVLISREGISIPTKRTIFNA